MGSTPRLACVPRKGSDSLPRRPRRGALRALVAGALSALLLCPPSVLGEAHAVPEILVTKPVHAVGMLYDALTECRSSLPERRRWEIAETIEREARRHGYDPLFVQAMVEIESTCLPTARSRMGALGLIQVKPTTARAVARDAGLPWEGADALYDPDFNVRVGLHYLNQLEERFGDPRAAIAAYNMGPTRAARLGLDRVRNSRYVRSILERYERLLAAQPASVGDPT